MNGLAGCSVFTIGKPHEYFDLTTFPRALTTLSSMLCLLFIHPPAHGSEVSPAARNTLDSARIPRASKLLICGLFQKGRVLAQDAALGPVANTDTKLLIYGLFQKGRVLAQDGMVWARTRGAVISRFPHRDWLSS